MGLIKISLKWAILLIPAIILVWVFVWKENQHDEIPVEIIQVEQGPISELLSATGKVVSQREVSLSPFSSGPLVSVHVREGEIVTKGMILARLDNKEVLRLVSKTEETLRRAQEGTIRAHRKVERFQKLFQVGFESHQNLDEAEAQEEVARTQEHLAREELRLANLAMSKLNVVAPFAGLITVSSARVGQWANSGTEIFRLVDVDLREIEAKIEAEDMTAVTVGQTVRIVSEGAPAQAWLEKVIRVAASTVSSDASSNQQKIASRVNIRISLGSNASFLRFGQQVNLKLETGSRPNALKLPFGAILSKERKSWAAVIQEGQVHLVPVKIGMEDATHIEIIQGLKVNQEVILPAGKELHEGDRVHPKGKND